MPLSGILHLTARRKPKLDLSLDHLLLTLASQPVTPLLQLDIISFYTVITGSCAIIANLQLDCQLETYCRFVLLVLERLEKETKRGMC